MGGPYDETVESAQYFESRDESLSADRLDSLKQNDREISIPYSVRT